MSEVNLDTKLVGEIQGSFYVPSYQRGYRWGGKEVKRLLDDVYSNGSNNYCLQPIVVSKSADRYELIDGQQRLTTIYLIYKYLHECLPKVDARFSISYQTRPASEQFLSNIDSSLKEQNIDFWHMSEAYEQIRDWFESQKDLMEAAMFIYQAFQNRVKVIWYEVGDGENAVALFTRFNTGKIELTNAELVKAMFLSRGNNVHMSDEQQDEIALQWDNIEKELHNPSLWSFLTNASSGASQTRIDLILDLKARKPLDAKDQYYTFFEFDSLKSKRSLSDIWGEIERDFLILKDWYEDHDLYHKIGYLIASESATLQEIFDAAEGKGKREFMSALDALIKDSIKLPRSKNGIIRSYAEWNYNDDYKRISRFLLLFNVESVRLIDGQTQRFPFDKFKNNSAWSLEHIHAQQSEGMRNEKEWREWLTDHLSSIKSIEYSGEQAQQAQDLIPRVEAALTKKVLDGDLFKELQRQIVDLLSVEGNSEYLHVMSNLALLDTKNNSALSNSTFDVKRNKIIEWDKEGQFIPFCTKMVFLKYYSPSSGNQLHFWGAADRAAYINEMNRVLQPYLDDSEKEAE